jgi:hypothetical protein
MSKSTDVLRDVLLIDSSGNKAKVIHIEGYADHFEIYTASKEDLENDICTRHMIKSEEIELYQLDLLVGNKR